MLTDNNHSDTRSAAMREQFGVFVCLFHPRRVPGLAGVGAHALLPSDLPPLNNKMVPATLCYTLRMALDNIIVLTHVRNKYKRSFNMCSF